MVKKSIQQINKNSEFLIHPILIGAYEFCQALPVKCNIDVLSAETQKLMRTSEIIFLHKKEDALYVIGGFENINFDITNVHGYSTHVLENMTEQEILEYCWLKIFRAFMFTVDNQKFGEVFELLKKFMPERVARKIIGKASFSQKLFSELTRTANSTISKQRGAKVNEIKSVKKLSILQEALSLRGNANVQ